MHSSLKLFGPAHLSILATVVGTGLLAGWAVRRWPSLWDPVRYCFAVLAAVAGGCWYLYRLFGLHDPLRWALPFEICDASLWLAVVALLWPRQRLMELLYFWGLAGAPMALLTPYLIAPLLSLPSITFLVGHGMIVISILFLLVTGRMRPGPRSWIFALGLLNAFALFDYIFDRLTGTNYMYLLHKPPIASLFNVMGPWPWYIVAADGIALVLFLALQWPFRGSPGRLGTLD